MSLSVWVPSLFCLCLCHFCVFLLSSFHAVSKFAVKIQTEPTTEISCREKYEWTPKAKLEQVSSTCYGVMRWYGDVLSVRWMAVSPHAHLQFMKLWLIPGKATHSNKLQYRARLSPTQQWTPRRPEKTNNKCVNPKSSTNITEQFNQMRLIWDTETSPLFWN